VAGAGNEARFTNLRRTLHRLQPLPEAQGLEIQGSALRYDVETDVDAFEAALREQRIADAVALRRGRLLLGFDDDANDAWSGWLRFERDRLHTAWRAAALELRRLASLPAQNDCRLKPRTAGSPLSRSAPCEV
jgi:hypothetical protein